MLQKFSRVNHPTEALTHPCHAPLRAWFAPTYGVIKINCDASVLGNDGVSGVGFVMRCHNGSVLVAGSRRVAFATSVVEAEAKAILWAIQMAQAKGFARVVLETYSAILVDAFKENKVLYHIRALFLHIRHLCLLFDSCSWSFVRREGNKVAHWPE
ncbi:reverse transcriptase [Tanacetum coccineum]